MTDRHEKAANDGGSIKVGDHARIWRRGDTWWINIQVHRRQVRRSLETTNKAEATKRALKIERGMVEGNLDLDRDKITLDEAIRSYDAFLVSEGRAKRTLTQYRHTFKLMRQIAAELGRPLLIQVDLTFVDRFRTLRVDQGKAPKTIHTETTILRQVVNHSRRRNLLSRDPFVDGGRKRRRGDRVAAVQNGGAQPCSSLGGEDRGDSPDHTPFQREAQECTATWRSGARYDVRC